LIAKASVESPTTAVQSPVASGARAAAQAAAPGNAGSFLSSLLDIVTASVAADAKSTATVPPTPPTSLSFSARKGGKEKETPSKQDDSTATAIPVTTPTTDTPPLLLRLLQFGLTIEPRSEKSAPVERAGSNSSSTPAAQNTEEDAVDSQSVAPPATDMAFALRLTDSQTPSPTPSASTAPASAQPVQASNDTRPQQQQPTAPVQPVLAAQPSQSNDNQPAAPDTNHNPKQQHDDSASATAKSEPATPAAVAAATQAPAPVISVAPPTHSAPPAPAQDAPPVAHTAQVNEPAEKPLSAAPAQRISLTVSDSQNKPVEVHLVERGGEVRVSVRSADEAMSHSMRADLGSLSGKLAQSGYNAESYTPAAANTASFSNERQSPEGRESSNGGRQNPQQNQSGGQQQSSRDGRGQRPAWVEELENSLASSAAIRSNTPWRQA
jgi:hypothetical protein